MAQEELNTEEIHTVLKGTTRSDGAKFDTILKWFKECGIIGTNDDEISETMFIKTYERLDKDRGDLDLTKMTCLLGMLSRQSDKPLKTLLDKFETVKGVIIEEIRQHWRDVINAKASEANEEALTVVESLEFCQADRIRWLTDTHDYN